MPKILLPTSPRLDMLTSILFIKSHLLTQTALILNAKQYKHKKHVHSFCMSRISGQSQCQ